MDVGRFAFLKVADWDGDGDLGLLVGHNDGKVHYFERLPNGSLQEQTESAFKDIDVGRFSFPQVMDWDGDGDLDLLQSHQVLWQSTERRAHMLLGCQR